MADLKISYRDEAPSEEDQEEEEEKEDKEEEEEKHTDDGALEEPLTQMDNKGKGIALQSVEDAFASPTNLVSTDTFDYEMIRNLMFSPIFDASIPPTFLQPGPSQVTQERPPDLTLVISSLGESTYKFLINLVKILSLKTLKLTKIYMHKLRGSIW